MHRKTLATSLIVVGFVVSLALASGVVSADTVFDLDKNTSLTADSSISQFESEGIVTARTQVPDMRITVSNSGDGVGASRMYTDLANTFVQVDYDESISRTVRFYIPKDYFYPITKSGLESIEGEAKADLRGVEDNAYTSFTVYLSGQTNATFAVSREAGVVFSIINNTKERSKKLFGVELPDIGLFGGAQDWEYVEAGHFSENQSTYAISHDANESVLIQYDESGPQEAETWVPVAECDAEEVCWFTKTGVEDKTFLLVQTSDPPAIRFKTKEGPVSGIGGFWNDLKQIPGRIFDDIFGMF